jgi:glycosyltransferase involved in cell wall biosynthesis
MAAAPVVVSAVPRVAGTPRVTIGLPVYQGERFLEETLDAIASQTIRDYELVICDNASTDRTREISEARAARDPRIRYVRNPANIGGDRNWNRCFELARGEYFIGVGYDDLLHPEYLERTVAKLEEDPAAVFCHTRAHRIDEAGRVTSDYAPQTFSTSPRPSERFYDAIRPVTGVVLCLGLIRSSALRKTPLLRPHPFSDSFLQAEMALRGRFLEVPEFLFSRRFHERLTSIYDRGAWCTPEDRTRILLPHWRRLGEYARVVARVPMPAGERARCFRMIGRYAREARVGRQLFRDVKMAARNAVLGSPIGPRVETLVRRRGSGR